MIFLFDGGEAIPILNNSKSNWKKIALLCKIIRKKVFVSDKTGTHIHIGAENIKNKENFFNLIFLWMPMKLLLIDFHIEIFE